MYNRGQPFYERREMTSIEELREVAKSIQRSDFVKEPLPVTITGTTFGNELQNKILTAMRIQSFFLFYLCTIQTLGHLGWFK